MDAGFLFLMPLEPRPATPPQHPWRDAGIGENHEAHSEQAAIRPRTDADRQPGSELRYPTHWVQVFRPGSDAKEACWMV